MKRALTLLLVAALVLSLAACGVNPTDESLEPGSDGETKKVGNTLDIANNNVPGGLEPTSEEPASEEPASEEPTSDEPVSDGKDKAGETTTKTPVSEEPASEEPTSDETGDEPGDETSDNTDEEEIEMKNPQVTIEMESGGKIIIELYPDKAPNTVNNFISLVKEGFYDGVIFHRVIYGFMIQGGDPDGKGTGGPGYGIDGEFKNNGFKDNDLKHERGVISMARSSNKNSAGSQFFIMHKAATHLDGDYAAFGRVLEGMDVVDAIAGTATDSNDRPKAEQIMKTVTVDTFGIDYPDPVTNKNR